MFSFLMMMGTLISVSSNSWMMAWLGMEMNLMGFTPLMISNYNKFSTEAAMKYFFIQTSSSSFLLLSIINPHKLSMMTQMMTLLALTMKLGASPFHFWVPSTAENIKFTPLFLLLTWQKIAPLFLMSFYKFESTKIILPIIMSALTGSIGGMSQTSIKKIISFSSISHLAWLISTILINQNLTWIYILTYSMMMFLVISMCNFSKLNHINQSMFLSKMNKINLFMMMMSLGGMPPFMTFFPKLLIIMILLQNNMFSLTSILLLSSMVNLYFYLRLTLSSITNMSFSIKTIKTYYMILPLIIITMSMEAIMMFS